MQIPERIYYLWQRYCDDHATEEELNELAGWLSHPQNDPVSLQYLLETLQQTSPLEQHSDARLQQLRQQLKSITAVPGDGEAAEEAYSQAPARTKRVIRLRIGYAAAAVLLVCLTTVLLMNRETNHNNATGVPPAQVASVQSDLPPGGERALLTLADGSTIVLDNAANGTVAQQGNTAVVKLDNGQLSYNGSSAGNKQVLTNTLRTPRGGKYHLTLSDGTEVWLNAASSITYPVAFGPEKRQVTIAGEVYFEVARNEASPFIVSVDPEVRSGRGMKVVVLGTHFNINAYPDEEVMRTTLLEGSIKISTADASKLLQPGQQAVVAHGADDTDIGIMNPANAEEAIAWKNGYFHFNRAGIKTVMRQIARWYDVEVVYEGPVPADTFIGELPMDANASQVLKALENVQVRFRIEGNKIIVKS